jgi:hypothetical protein
MFNQYGFGGYLAYRFYPDPNRRVFIFGEAALMGDGLLNEYADVYYVRSNWKQVLDKYRVDYVVENNGDPLPNLLATQPDWRLVYQDNVSVIYVRQGPLSPPGSRIVGLSEKSRDEISRLSGLSEIAVARTASDLEFRACRSRGDRGSPGRSLQVDSPDHVPDVVGLDELLGCPACLSARRARSASCSRSRRSRRSGRRTRCPSCRQDVEPDAWHGQHPPGWL